MSGTVTDALGGSEITHLVEGAIGPPTLGLHHHIGMQEVGRNHVRYKGRVLILEDHSDDVVPDVPLSLQLSTGSQASTTGQRGATGHGGGYPSWGGQRLWGRQRARLIIHSPRPDVVRNLS